MDTESIHEIVCDLGEYELARPAVELPLDWNLRGVTDGGAGCVISQVPLCNIRFVMLG